MNRVMKELLSTAIYLLCVLGAYAFARFSGNKGISLAFGFILASMLIPDIVRITGLTDRQVRTIIFRRMKEAPLPIALQLSRTLDVPVEVWTGNEEYKAAEISMEAREVAKAYDRADEKSREIVRLAVGLPPMAKERIWE